MPDSLDTPYPRREPALAIRRRRLDDRTAVVMVEGDLDLRSAPELKRSLGDLLESGHNRLVLDLGRVQFIDSTALGVMVGIQRRLSGDERMAIAEAGPEVLSVFELSGLAASFQIFPTRDAAIRYVTQAPGAGQGHPPPLTADAALMLGIASTAMPFAQSAEDQAARWLRALRRHGEAGAVLASLGVSDAPVSELANRADGERSGPGDPDPVVTVTEHASRLVVGRGGKKLHTTDVLRAVMHVYGATFDRVLAAHGVDIDELAARIASANPRPPTAKARGRAA